MDDETRWNVLMRESHEHVFPVGWDFWNAFKIDWPKSHEFPGFWWPSATSQSAHTEVFGHE